MPPAPPAPGPLLGLTVGVTAHRSADEQVELLERKGATVLHGPAIQTRPLMATAELAAATRAVVASPPDYTLLTTGIGVRAWFEAAESLDLADALLDALRGSTVIARGPKAHGAAVTNGLPVDWQTPNGWAAEMVEHLTTIGVAGKVVAVQLDGASGEPLAKVVRAIGATVVPVPVYEWTLPGDPAPAERLIDAVIDARLDAITFTARPQVENLLAIAERMGRSDDLLRALADADLLVACVGPVCAQALRDAGLPAPIQPRRYRLGSMVLALAGAAEASARDIVLAGTPIRLQGRAVVIGGAVPVPDPILLTDKEREVLRVLADRPGVVLSKAEILNRVWHDTQSDQHVVEVTVGRLRQRLGEAGAGIETVIRRGYRLTDR